MFVEVAATGSYSIAADRLDLSKSTVSKHVAALEDRLRLRLFNRSTRRLSLTESGAIYRERCLRVLEAVEEADRSVSHLASAPHGRLKVAAPLSFGLGQLSPLIPLFLDRHPEIEVELVLDDRRVDLVAEGYDVAIRIGRLDDSSLIARRLAASPLRCVAAPAYLAARPEPTHPAELAGLDCLRYSYGRSPNEWSFERGGEVVRVRVDGRLVANNGEVLRDAAEAGRGVAYLPLFLLGERLEEGRLVTLFDDWSTLEVVVHAVFPETRHLPPKLRAFLDFLGPALGRRAPWQVAEGARA